MHDDNLPAADYRALLEAVFEECHRALVEGGRIAVVVPAGTGRNPWRPLAARVTESLTRTGFTLRGDGSGCDLSFVSISAAAYDWDPDTEQPPDPAVPTPIPSEQTVNAPENLSVVIERPSVSGDVAGVLTQLPLTVTGGGNPVGLIRPTI